jgi:hypothetical protein
MGQKEAEKQLEGGPQPNKKPDHLKEMPVLNIGELLAMEEIYVRERRKEKFPEDTEVNVKEDSLGIALSGGGIRSATLCLGLMKELNNMGLIEKADYLSSVSGGGYLASYIHTSLAKKQAASNPYDELFEESSIKHFRAHRKHLYIWPKYKLLSQIVLALFIVGLFLLSWLWLILPFGFLTVICCYKLPSVGLSCILLLALMLLPGLIFSSDLTFIHRGISQLRDRLKDQLAKSDSGQIIVLLVDMALVGLSAMLLYGGLTAFVFWAMGSTSTLLGIVGSALVVLLLVFVPGLIFSPNFTSPHIYYKRRLQRAYLWPQKNIKLTDLQQSNGPYPLINATVHVDKDDYYKAKVHDYYKAKVHEKNNTEHHKAEKTSISYRGTINANYFLFSPYYCGSQITYYANNSKSLYANISLATAMATSGAAVNTFMGNMNLSMPIRWMMILGNFRTGYLAPSPLFAKRLPVFWPFYTALEVQGKAKTTSYKIQVSDGGHIENLAVFELLRRQVKTIIVIDGGQDNNFDFFDLRNLTIRARNELGIVIEFEKNNGPSERIKPDLITGTSQSHFAVAKVKGLKGSYTSKYEGVLVYIKSSVLTNKDYQLRRLKKEVAKLKAEMDASTAKIKTLKREIKALKKGHKREDLEQKQKELKAVRERVESKITPELEQKRRELDHVMYRTYTPKFPHETTANQFFSEEQWDAYYHLGENIGKNVLKELGLEKEDSRLDIHNKCAGYNSIIK